MPINTGYVYHGKSSEVPLNHATTTFTVDDGSGIIMNKTVNKANEVYFPGDEIIFTITLLNNTDKIMENLKFEDTIDASIIPITGQDFIVTASAGTITKKNNPIIVTGILINPKQTVTITITGKVVKHS